MTTVQPVFMGLNGSMVFDLKVRERVALVEIAISVDLVSLVLAGATTVPK